MNNQKNTLHLTNTVVMVPPDTFGFNEQTASSNPFQHKTLNAESSSVIIQKKAMAEFQNMVAILRRNNIKVIILPNKKNVATPDAVFPNNWFSTHEDGALIVYPMLAPNRRLERQTKLLVNLLIDEGYCINKTIDLTPHEMRGEILEGTGSLVIDRNHRYIFAIESPRTNKRLFRQFCSRFGYRGILFRAEDTKHRPIYHTNVFMALGSGFCVICLDAIAHGEERKIVIDAMRLTYKTVIDITQQQLYSFCGNLLHLIDTKGEKRIVLSQKAHDAFTEDQRKILRQFGDLLPIPIDTIETIGGGSARCMMAEIFLPVL